jgi:hypothetical protein
VVLPRDGHAAERANTPLRGESLLKPELRIKAKPDRVDLRAPEVLDLWSSFESFAEGQPATPRPDSFGIPGYRRSTGVPRLNS